MNANRNTHRPLVGINVGVYHDDRQRAEYPVRYADAVRRAGGLPIAIYPSDDADECAELVARLDALLLSGGDDFDAEALGLGATHPEATPVPLAKQNGDLALVRAALRAELPTLGICYGMQLMALVRGGTLLQHLPEDRPGCQQHWKDARHAVDVVGDSRLAGVVGDGPLLTLSRHHQAIDGIGAGWRVAARDGEGLVEAIEDPDLAFAIGVQWHPELATDDAEADERQSRLVAALVRAATDGARDRARG